MNEQTIELGFQVLFGKICWLLFETLFVSETEQLTAVIINIILYIEGLDETIVLERFI